MSVEWEMSWPDPCPSCGQSSAHELRGVDSAGVMWAGRRCWPCGYQWMEQAPDNLDLGSIVRAYSGSETSVGFIDEIKQDLVKVSGRWLERWQVVIY